MTFTNQTNRTSAVGSGSTGQEVPFLFPIKATSDLTVKKRITATGVETTLDETTNYTIVISGDSGGTLTTVTTIETTEEIHLIRNTPNTQTLDLEQGGSFNAENVEDAFDKNAKLIIENKDAIGRLPAFPDTDPLSSIGDYPNSVDRANLGAAFDSAGKPTAVSVVPTGSVAFTVFGTALAEAANAGTARGLIGLDTDDNVEFAEVTATDVITKAPWVDVRAFGAVGDDATDDRTSIFNANAVGKPLLFPSGTYKISSDLTISQQCIFLEGAKLSPDSGKTITISASSFEAGSYQVFTGNGSIAFSALNVLKPQWFPGADTGIKIQAAIDSLSSTGGIVDGRRYYGSQTISSTVTIGSASRPVQLLLSPMASFEPATVGLTMFNIKANGRISGVDIDTTGLSFTGTGILVDGSHADGQLTQISDCLLEGLVTGGTGIALKTTSGAGTEGIVFVSVKHIRIIGFFHGLKLDATDANQFVNGNKFEDIEIKNSNIGFILLGNASGFVHGNIFSNITYQAGADSTIAVDIERGTYNQFLNFNIWDMPTGGSIYEVVIRTFQTRNLLQGRLDLKNIINVEAENTLIDMINNRPMVEVVRGASTWDPASIANGAEEAKEVTVAGAVLGDFALASFSLDVQDLVLNVQITASDTATCILANNTGGAIDLGEGTISVKVIKQ